MDNIMEFKKLGYSTRQKIFNYITTDNVFDNSIEIYRGKLSNTFKRVTSKIYYVTNTKLFYRKNKQQTYYLDILDILTDFVIKGKISQVEFTRYVDKYLTN